ncbi:AAA family ATPase [Sphingomonas sp. AR_OL41]|uniref:ExeA family protein n=1 Tax=Sphingomonas sp. AR_OL41 TaxID=3042729 RepID=UPI00247FA709|nr:AAA family ATPase [Sphingomonas sp. AR_OL41]MDH7972248.1 AAA family ATPase [Sphingomonas sp. AR_OL41]
MYDEHYGLSGRPFQLTPDPRFWFDTVTHKKAMAYLGYGLAQGEGFIVITGEVGTGKTTLVGHLMATIDRERLLAIRIASTQIEPDDLLRMVANGLDLDPDGMTKSQLLSSIERGLHATARAGRRTLLVVDEAQALNIAALEELRMLSNLQAGGHALLQIFLLGQPEFRARLQGAGRLEQLRQRVIAMHHLEPMGPEEVEPYMFHRLLLVGWRGRPRFTADAFDALYRGSEGVPRRLNQLAARVMLHGAIEQLDTLDARVVDAVIDDVSGDMPSADAPPAAPIPVAPMASPAPIAPPTAFAAPEAAVDAPSPLPIRGLQEPVAAAPSVATVPEVAPAVHDATARLAALEARVDEQDAALRRVLTLMIDWIEGDQRPDAAALRRVTG